MKRLAYPIKIGRSTLGTTNHTLLTLRAAEQAGIPVKGVILNRAEAGGKDAIEQEHARIISELSGVPVLGKIPFLGQISEKSFSGELLEKVEASLDFSEIRPKKAI